LHLADYNADVTHHDITAMGEGATVGLLHDDLALVFLYRCSCCRHPSTSMAALVLMVHVLPV
jgi:hypothetical protein